MQTSAPLPSVSALDRLDRVVLRRVDGVGRAELRRPLELLRVEVDGDDRARARPACAAAIAALPTPPHPNTATVSPRWTPPVFTAAPKPAITPQPSSPAASGVALASTFVAWPAATSVFSANAPMPSAGESAVPSASVIFCVALCVEKQYQGRPRRHARHSPHTARQLRTTKSPGATHVTSGADRLDDARRLVPEQEREVVADAALAVVQVGVAHAARLHPHERLAGPGIGHHDRLDAHRLALAGAMTPRTS